MKVQRLLRFWECSIPRTTANTGAPFSLAAQADPTARPIMVNMRLVSPSYFRTLGVRIV